MCYSSYPPQGQTGANRHFRSRYPTAKLAAVLVLLYEKDDHIQVLLTTRSKHLRSHPGQTALPGGKYDETDLNIVETAVSKLQVVCFEELILSLQNSVSRGP